MEPTIAQVEMLSLAGTPAQRRRTWPALLALLVLSPLVGEVISGSTPPLLAIQPLALIFLPALYGISAALIHAVVACTSSSSGIEFGLRLPARTGMAAFNLLVFVTLLPFDRRLKRRASPSTSAPGVPVS